MKHLKRISARSAPPGLERKILRRLPTFLIGGTLIPVFAAIAVRWIPQEGPASAVAKKVSGVDIFAIAAVITVWTAVFTIAIGCVFVVIMKGPGYASDPHPVDEEQRQGQPGRDPRDDDSR